MNRIRLPDSLDALQAQEACIALLHANPTAFQALAKDKTHLIQLREMEPSSRDTAIVGYDPYEDDHPEAVLPPDRSFTPSEQLDQGTSEATTAVTAEQLHSQRVAEGSAEGEQPAFDRIPPWNRGKFRFSKYNFRGGRFTGQLADGEEHLVPERGYVRLVVLNHKSVNDAIERRAAGTWYEQFETALESKNHPLHDVFETADSHFDDLHRRMAQLPRLWMPQSFALRNAAQQALARRTAQALDLREATAAMRIEMSRGPVDAESNVQKRFDFAQRFYDDARDQAAFWTTLWRHERLRELDMQNIAAEALRRTDPSALPPQIQTNPDSIDLEYAVIRHLEMVARYEEKRMLQNPGTVASNALGNEAYDDLAL